MAKATYYALVHKDQDSLYGVSFPDFPGCISADETLEKAVTGAQEALQFHIDGMREDEEPIPTPSKREGIDDKDARIVSVHVDV